MVKNMSLRDFAKYAKVSPQRVLELVKDGKIKRLESGLIPSSELEFFIRESILKSIKGKRNSVLAVCVGDTESTFSEKKEALGNATDKRYMESVDELVALVQKQSMGFAAFGDDEEGRKKQELFAKEFYTSYKIQVLKEFKKRFLDAVYRNIRALDEISEVKVLPLGVLEEMFKYGRLFGDYGVSEEEARKVLSQMYKGKSKSFVPLNGMQSSFQAIIRALNMFDTGGQPVISTEDLCPEFLSAVDTAAPSCVTEDSPLYGFMSSDIRFGGGDAEKIKLGIINARSKTERLLCIADIMSQGVYACRNITVDTDIHEIEKLIREIGEGYYTRVMVLSPEEFAEEHLNTAFYTYLQAVRCTCQVDVVFGYQKGLI